MFSLLFLFFMLTVSSQSELHDILHDTDRFFLGLQLSPQETIKEVEKFKLTLKRSYGLTNEDGRPLRKRSLTEKTSLVRDEKGVFIIDGIQDAASVPAKFPNDLQILSTRNNGLLAVALESNQNKPQDSLANNLVLYEFDEEYVLREIERVEISGGFKLASFSFQNATFVLSSEYEAESKRPFRGSSLYGIFNYGGRTLLEKVQILNITHPRDLKFWEHQEQIYLAVGTGDGTVESKSYTLIFKWLGHNFDFIQKIEGNRVQCVTPFVIGSTMFLAVGNHRDIHGNTDINSDIFRFHLQSEKFSPYQEIKTHAVKDIVYFSFHDSEVQKDEHFLVVANFFERDYDGSANYKTNSVMYKFDNERFVPFQNFKLYAVTQWVPIKGSKGEFILLAVCSHSVLGFQYDGWRFTEVGLDYGQSSFGKDILSMRSFIYNENTYLSVADKSNHGSATNLWKLTFKKQNFLKEHYNEVENWCQDMKTKAATDDFESRLNEINLSLSGGTFLERKLKLDHADIDTLETMNFGVLDSLLVDRINAWNERIKILRNIFNDFKKRFENMNNIVYYDVTGLSEIPYLELSCCSDECCLFEYLTIGQLNAKDFEHFMNNAVLVHEDMDEHSLDFENLHVIHDLSPSYINGHPADTLIDTASVLYLNSDLIVNGTVIIQGDLQVKDYDPKIFRSEGSLLLDGPENMNGELILNSAMVKNLEISGKLNGVKIDDIVRNSNVKLQDTYEKLNIHDLFVNGTITGFGTDNHTEKNQDFVDGSATKNSTDTMNVLTVDEIFVKSGSISEVPISNIVQIASGGHYMIRGPVNFTQPILEPHYLDVKSINGVSMDKKSHASMEEEIISDTVIVKGTAVLGDLMHSNTNSSIFEILDKGILLDQTTIESELAFHQVEIEDAIIEFLNNVSVGSWVLKNSEEPQIIRGKKQFLGNVKIEKNAAIEYLNGLDVVELFNDAMLLDDDQIASGNMSFNSIKSAKIVSNTTYVGGEKLKLKPKSLTIYSSVDLESLSTVNLSITGLVDGLFWSDIVHDSVLNQDDFIVGQKTVLGHVEARHINIAGSVNSIPIDKLVKDSDEEDGELELVVLNQNVFLNSSIGVEHLIFEGSLDSIEKNDFGRTWLLTEDEQTILAPMVFRDVTLKSGSVLKNEIVNNVNLKKMFRESIKLNDSVHIRHLAVANSVKAREVNLLGTLNGAVFKDVVVLSESSDPQYVNGKWFFNQNLMINGSLVVEGLISGIDAAHICSRNPSDQEEINLIVGGSVTFETEPRISGDVNGVNLIELSKAVWFKNENVTVGGRKKFCDSEMHNKIHLEGKLNGIRLSDLSKSYFSKTLNKYTLEDVTVRNLIIRDSCRIHNMTVRGRVNGIELSEWSQNVLLQDVDQVITGFLHFSEFKTNDLILNGTINDIDMVSGVLRYDIPDAVVIGEKTFTDLTVFNLTLSEGKTLQGVDVDYWARNAVTKDGNFTIKGNLTLQDPIFKGGLKVLGKVNDLEFNREHILVTGGNQMLTGKKTFNLTNYPNQTLSIDELEIKSVLSGVDLNSILKNQAYRNRDLIFTESKTFEDVLTADCMTVDGLFQSINISEICHDVFHPLKTGNLSDKYQPLLAKAKRINKYFEERPFFLDHYEEVQMLNEVVAVLPFSSDSVDLISVITPTDMKLMEWDFFSERFVYNDDVLSLADNVSFATSGVISQQSFLYLELFNSSRVYINKNLKEINVKNTSCVTSFNFPSSNKLCFFVGRKWSDSLVFCDNSEEDLQNFQTLESLGTIQASTLHVQDDVYIAVIKKENITDHFENVLTIYKLAKDRLSFLVNGTLPEINPVAVSTISYGPHHHFLVLAGGHLPGSVDTSIVTVFRLNRESDAFVRYQSLMVDTPVDVHLAVLPTSELVLYVLSSNPTKPFIVYVYRGIRGFVEETSGLSLVTGNRIYSLTDSLNKHFVFISGFGRGQILKAGFKGNKKSSQIW